MVRVFDTNDKILVKINFTGKVNVRSIVILLLMIYKEDSDMKVAVNWFCVSIVLLKFIFDEKGVN